MAARIPSFQTRLYVCARAYVLVTRGDNLAINQPHQNNRTSFLPLLEISDFVQCCFQGRGKKKKKLGGKKESEHFLEPTSNLQNKAVKTNKALKLDFPKHSVPSHFTHHCDVQTRIEQSTKKCPLDRPEQQKASSRPFLVSLSPVFRFYRHVK